MSSKVLGKREKLTVKARAKRQREETEQAEAAPPAKRSRLNDSLAAPVNKLEAFKIRMLNCRKRVLTTALNPALQCLRTAETQALIQIGPNPLSSKRIRENYARLVLRICAAHTLELDYIRHSETIAELLEVLKTALEEMQSAANVLDDYLRAVDPRDSEDEFGNLVSAGDYIQKYIDCLTEVVCL